jgi:hypothetical protein
MALASEQTLLDREEQDDESACRQADSHIARLREARAQGASVRGASPTSVTTIFRRAMSRPFRIGKSIETGQIHVTLDGFEAVDEFEEDEALVDDFSQGVSVRANGALSSRVGTRGDTLTQRNSGPFVRPGASLYPEAPSSRAQSATADSDDDEVTHAAATLGRSSARENHDVGVLTPQTSSMPSRPTTSASQSPEPLEGTHYEGAEFDESQCPTISVSHDADDGTAHSSGIRDRFVTKARLATARRSHVGSFCTDRTAALESSRIKSKSLDQQDDSVLGSMVEPKVLVIEHVCLPSRD